MNESSERLFSGAQPNPDMAGIPLRGPLSGAAPMSERIVAAAELLSRPVQYVDSRGFEQEITAASPIKADGALAYVTTSAKDVGSHVDISIRFHLRDAQSQETVAEIESYNAYFGCEVRHLEWMGDAAILIYREKHNTYVAAAASGKTPRFLAIADAWVIKDDLLGYWKHRASEVQLLRLPALEALEPITETAAMDAGVRPAKRW